MHTTSKTFTTGSPKAPGRAAGEAAPPCWAELENPRGIFGTELTCHCCPLCTVPSESRGQLALPDRPANSKKKKNKSPSHTGKLQQVQEKEPALGAKAPGWAAAHAQLPPCRNRNTHSTVEHLAFQHSVLKRTTLRLKNNNLEDNLRKILPILL